MAKSASLKFSRFVEWKVDNIFSAPKHESEVFSFSGSRWYLKLVKLFSPMYAYEVIRIYLNKTDSNKDLPSAFRTCVYITGFNRQPDIKQQQHWSTWCSGTHVWEANCEEFREWKDEHLKHDVVKFIIVLSPENISGAEKDGNGIQPYMNSASEASAESLAADFRRLLDDGMHSDVTLKSRDVTIPAHSLILSTRSEVFAAMLRSDIVESRSGIVEISDMDPPVLRQLVQFIYSGKLSDLTTETAPQLYAAGDKYAVETLKSQCSAFMKENLAEGNACSILILADAHSDRDLRDCAIAYIMDTELTQNDDVWPRFCDDHPKLAIEVLNRICKATKSSKQ